MFLCKSSSVPDLSRFKKLNIMKDKDWCERSAVVAKPRSPFLKRKSIARYVIHSRTLGKGRYSVVRLAVDTKSKKTVAAKIVDLARGVQVDVFRQEVTALSRIVHPNVVELLNSEICSGKGVLFMELLPLNTLSDFLDSNGAVSESAVIPIFLQVVKAVKAAHLKNIAHNDLKPENIAYDPIIGLIKLFDFGLATVVNPNCPMISFNGGSPLYMAPEILNERHNPFLSDIWSLGIILYELLDGAAPFAGCDDLKELLVFLAKGSSEITYPEQFSQGIITLLSRIFQNEPAARISIEEIISSLENFAE